MLRRSVLGLCPGLPRDCGRLPFTIVPQPPRDRTASAHPPHVCAVFESHRSTTHDGSSHFFGFHNVKHSARSSGPAGLGRGSVRSRIGTSREAAGTGTFVRCQHAIPFLSDHLVASCFTQHGAGHRHASHVTRLIKAASICPSQRRSRGLYQWSSSIEGGLVVRRDTRAVRKEQ